MKIVALFFTSALILSADTITIRADEWCPYNCDPKSDKPGFMIEIAKEAFGKAGHTVDYQLLPWSRALREAEAGKIVAVVGASKEEADEHSLLAPSIEQGVSENVFIVKKGNVWRFKGVESLNEITLGAIKDYAYSKEIDGYIKKNIHDPNKIGLIAGEDALGIDFRKLLLGRIDVLIETKYVAQYKAKELSLQNEVEIAGVDADGDVRNFIAFSSANPKSKEYANLLSKGTEELRASGKLKEILVKYGLEDWKK